MYNNSQKYIVTVNTYNIKTIFPLFRKQIYVHNWINPNIDELWLICEKHRDDHIHQLVAESTKLN